MPRIDATTYCVAASPLPTRSGLSAISTITWLPSARLAINSRSVPIGRILGPWA